MNCCHGGHDDHDQNHTSNQPNGINSQHEPNNPEVPIRSGMGKNLFWVAVIGVMLYGIWQAISTPGLGVKAANLLPYLGLLMCPLMMVFMMFGHGHGGAHGGHHHDADAQNNKSR